MKHPCYGCTQRHRACHDSCEKFKKSTEEAKRRKEVRATYLRNYYLVTKPSARVKEISETIPIRGGV